MHLYRISFIIASLLIHITVLAQTDHEQLIAKMISDTPIEEDLMELVDGIGGRVTGTTSNEQSVLWGFNKFREAGVVAHLEKFEMPSRWIPKSSTVDIYNQDGSIQFRPLAVSKYKSKPGQYSGTIIYVEDGDPSQFELNKAAIPGNFVLVSADLCFDIDGLFAEYVHAKKVEDLAHQYGAAGIVYMASRPSKLLYRFISSTGDEESIPQMVIAREDAKRSIRLIEEGEQLRVEINIEADTGTSYETSNVIAEIKGAKYPDEVIIVGAHIDSWALGTGANDNGCNVAMMIDIARQMQAANIRPDRTIRFALWNGEEQGYFGSLAYTIDHIEELDDHKLAISIDIGSGAILGYFTNGRDDLIDILDEIQKPIAGLGTFFNINAPIVGTDNFDFMLQGVPNLVARHKPDLYGLNYHAASDTYDKVNLESLKINSAIVASTLLQYANLPKETLDKIQRQSRNAIDTMIDKHNLEFTMKMFDVWDSWEEGTRGRK